MKKVFIVMSFALCFMFWGCSKYSGLNSYGYGRTKDYEKMLEVFQKVNSKYGPEDVIRLLDKQELPYIEDNFSYHNKVKTLTILSNQDYKDIENDEVPSDLLTLTIGFNSYQTVDSMIITTHLKNMMGVERFGKTYELYSNEENRECLNTIENKDELIDAVLTGSCD